MAAPRRQPSPPPNLPGFEFKQLLGSGGFSDVYLYEQQLPKRPVAVKVLLGGDALGDSSRQAFIDEANLMAQMSSHPYIVTIFQAAVADDGRPYFVMEYASGRSLNDRYKREVIPIEEVLRTGVRVSSAVATAHSVGILHRDVKPANILTNAYGWPALTDFGISSAVDDELAAAAGQDSGAGGGMSVPWSPPEMFDDDPHPDVRSEVFSLAATIYTLVAGHTPFEIRGGANGTIDLIGRIERGQITPITRSDVPRSLVAVLSRAMSVRPDDRYQSAVEFARALQRIEMELGYTPTPIDVPTNNVAMPARSDEPDADETSMRSVATIDAQGSYSGGRAGDAELTSARSVARIAAQGPGADADETTSSGVRSINAAQSAPNHFQPSGPFSPEQHSGPAAANTASHAPNITQQPPVPSPGGNIPEFEAPLLMREQRASEPVRPVFERQGHGRIQIPEDTADNPQIAALRGRSGVGSTASVPSDPRQRDGDTENPYADAPKPKNRNLLIGILSGIIVVLFGVLAVLGWVFRPTDPTPAGPTTGGPGPVVVGPTGYPQTPVNPVAIRGADGYITFRWENPDPQSGDTFFWRISDNSQPGQTTKEPIAVVGPSPEGVKVCINVEIRRAGKTSPQPLTACYPQ